MTRARMLASALCAIAFAAPPPVAAQSGEPRLNERGCGVAADMVLVARSLSQEKVERATAARIMEHVYVSYAGHELMVRLRERSLALGYTRTEKPMDLARLVGQACLLTGGDEGAMFGTHIRWRPAPPRGLRVRADRTAAETDRELGLTFRD